MSVIPMVLKDQCPVWGTPARILPVERYLDLWDVLSPRAGGHYLLEGFAKLTLGDSFDNERRVRLTDYIFQQNSFGSIPKIGQKEISNRNFGKKKSIHEMTSSLLNQIGKFSNGFGERIYLTDYQDHYSERNTEVDHKVVDQTNYLMASSSVINERELYFFIKHLHAKGFLKINLYQNGKYNFHITTRGYTELENNQNKNLYSEIGFVAMSFSEDMISLYSDAIKPGIEQSGHEAVRVDRVEHNENINDKIISEIKKSKFIVADFTSDREITWDGEKKFLPISGVYFEAGFAHGLGIPVIWTCRSDQLHSIHFDTSQFNHIAWNNYNDLKEKLPIRIEAVVGRGPK